MKVFGLVAAIMVMLLLTFIVGNGLRWFDGAVEVAHEEFGAKELLRKYEWFKNAAAALDEKKASIEIFTKRVTTFEADYKGVPRKDWPRDDRERHGQITTELVGLKAAFNSLAGDYNAQMAKINWAFCNAGDLPKGAAVPLPREYKPYILD